jgi:DNA-binding response OmpR family regulator
VLAVSGNRDRADLRALVVEDEAMIAMLIEDMLLDAGCTAVDVAGRMDSAMRFAETGSYDFVILDVNLGGTPSYPIADVLAKRDIPVIFATGYGVGGLKASYAGAPTLQKPFVRADLEAIISGILSVR